MPAFAQQTGEPCTTCHIGGYGPQLTPLGRAFKIGGYTQTGGEGLASKIPLSLRHRSFTNTTRRSPEPPPRISATTTTRVRPGQRVSRRSRPDYAGAFVQGTYSGVDRAFLLDNTDIRLTTPLSLGDSELRIGASLNNGPTVQDPFNSTPVWMFPFASSALAPTPAAQPLLAGGLVGNSLGLTAYVWYDRHLYLEAGGTRPTGQVCSV